MHKVMNQELIVVVMPNGSLQLEWTNTQDAVSKNSRLLQKEIYKRFTTDADSWLLFLGFCDHQVLLSTSLDYWRSFAGAFAKRLSKTPDLEILRHKVRLLIEKDELKKYLELVPPMIGSEYLSVELLEDVWKKTNRSFILSIKSYDGTVEAFIKSYSPNVHLVGRVFFHLVENKSDDCPFAFMATYSTGLNKQGRSKHLPLKYALQEYADNNDKLLELLATVHTAAGKSPLIEDLLETGELFHPLAWTTGEAFTFLKEIPVFEESGILCRMPDWWKGSRSSLKLNFSVGDSKPSFAGMDAILNFNARLFLGNTQITEKEARQLLDESEGLAFIKNKWVAVDQRKLKQTLDAYEKAKKMMGDGEGLSLKDAFRLQLMPEKLMGINTQEIDQDISNGKWLKTVVQKLRDPDLITSIRPDKTFKAKLRKYQQKGLNWLYFLHSLQFGACLADDMGLGKTVQALAFLNKIKSNFTRAGKPNKASLLIVPASLISNWENEIKRFSPEIKFYIAHPGAGEKKNIGPKDKKTLDAFDLVITTYALIQRYKWLQSHSWNYIILDEAQAIKNPGTKQTRAIKNLVSHNRIIMTGTPIENRLTDIWSLFDFLNPGLLGNAGEFKKFSKGLKDNPSGYSRLRKLISPYILRRLKSDKSVISDLPEKVEMKTYASLSKKQVVLYKNVVEMIKQAVAETEGIQRKGLILSSLMKFKQICNHPDQYLGTGEFEEKESGKFLRLREICETIYDKREKVLIFTQFKQMAEPLCDFLETIFNREGLILHGSVAVNKRKKIIEQFQSKNYVPFMVLSLKAGGVGLNLTAANHVIHFDRWWNPAVENQATDRVFRIGQKKNVIVHKFLTKGTVEERIDMMLEEKSKLSQDIIGSAGDKWITEMKDNELIDLFKLTL
ncbi:MAG: DEAD/DEAH box helicase [Deltaproteobacteria bacterium]|nr:DEAD/DEAH box helicase [Deltaproteobacteria bacterium]MBW2661470.1 DEAD/DEAH box helicase [Deltaproteobacteria bacterium]